MSEQLTKHFDLALKIATTFALISVALLGTKFVTKEEFIAANSRIEKIEQVLIRMEANAETGIEQWFGAITAIDLANYRVNTGIADIKLQNIGSTPLVISGARIYRDDNTSILDASPGDQPMTMDAGNLIQYIAPQIDGAMNANAKLAKVAANAGLIPSLL
jgi:hypothetical protein